MLYGGGVGVPTSITVAPSSNQFLGETAGVPTWKTVSLTASVSGILPIANGGTGATTLAGANIALTTGNLSQFAATTSAQLAGVISDETGSGSLVFATSPVFSGNVGFGGSPSYAIDVVQSSSGADITITVRNTSNTASSNSVFFTQVAGSSANDPKIYFSVNGITDWSIGIDNTDSDKFKLSRNANLGTNDAFAIDVSNNTIFSGTGQFTRLGLGGAIGATNGLDITAPAANDYCTVIRGHSTSGQSLGLIIGAGTTSADSCARFYQYGLSTLILNIRGDGGIAFATGSTVGFYGTAPVVQQTSAANLTNNVTSGGTNDTIADFTSLTVYATDAAAIRNDIYQLARKLKQINDGLRSYGLFT